MIELLAGLLGKGAVEGGSADTERGGDVVGGLAGIKRGAGGGELMGVELNAGYRRPPGRRYRDRIRPGAMSGTGTRSGPGSGRTG